MNFSRSDISANLCKGVEAQSGPREGKSQHGEGITSPRGCKRIIVDTSIDREEITLQEGTTLQGGKEEEVIARSTTQ